MSDTGRKDLTSSIQETVTPDSQKSALDKAKESATDATDSVAAAVQPGDSKSTTQKLSDETGASGGGSVIDTVKDYATSAGNAISSTASDLTQKASSATGTTGAGGDGKGYLEQAQEVLANAATTASKAAQDIANKITGSENK